MRPGTPCSCCIEFLFEAAEAVVVHADVAQHLRGDLVVGIEALELLLEVDALHIEGADCGGDLGRDAARDPGKAVAVVEAVRQSASSVVCLSSGSVWTIAARVRAAAFLSSISDGIGVDGVDLHGHGQLAQVAVVENAAARSHLKGALLLLFGALHVFLVAHDLQPEETAAMARPRRRKKRHTSQKRASFIGMARGVDVRGRLARRVACMLIAIQVSD